MFDSLGGQTVTVGKTKSEIGVLVIVVSIGHSCHSLQALLMIQIAMPKLTHTITTRIALAATDLAEEM